MLDHLHNKYKVVEQIEFVTLASVCTTLHVWVDERYSQCSRSTVWYKQVCFSV